MNLRVENDLTLCGRPKVAANATSGRNTNSVERYIEVSFEVARQISDLDPNILLRWQTTTIIGLALAFR